MINPHELRLGNYYHLKHDKGWTITIIDENILGKIFTDSDSEYALDDFEPIKLGIEWFRMFGFDGDYANIVNSTHGCSIEHSYYSKHNDGIGKYFLIDCDGGEIGLELLYVHQLQNLYYSLEGKNLYIDKWDDPSIDYSKFTEIFKGPLDI